MGRQLSSFDNTTYSYNESGIRTSKTVGENTTKFYLNGTNVIYQTDGETDIYFFYDRNDEIVGFKYNDNNYFYVKNAMGDITDIADSSGVVVASYTYDPWGKVTSVSGSNLAIANLNPFRYRSYYYDDDIDMYYLQTRYYDPEVGRFINCDDVNYIGLTKSSGSYNPFAYCESNPINQKDTTGSFGTPIQWACSMIGGIIGVPFGNWLANKLGYSGGWKYWAIVAAAVAGGIALGWFVGTKIIKLIKIYLLNNPQTMIEIVKRFGPNALYKIQRIIGISFSTIYSDTEFTSYSSLYSHFSKHAAEWGGKVTSVWQYLSKARKLLKEKSSNIEEFVSKDGWYFRYNKKTMNLYV